MVASFPHFHLAEEKYVDAITGMSPQREHHQTFLDLNPVSLRGQFLFVHKVSIIADQC